jgi:hypothetical protein
MSEPLTDAELIEIERDAASQLRDGKFHPPGIVRLIAARLPLVVHNLRAARSELTLLRRDYDETLNVATRGVEELREQIAARDAQIARLRQVVEGAEVANAEP